MSLFNRFSVAYNIERANKQGSDLDDSLNKTIKSKMRMSGRDFINEDIVAPLVGFGYKMEQIMLAFKLYKFATVDEAIYILMKDLDTGKYNHRFIKSETQQERGYGRITDSLCYLCGDEINEHQQYDLDTTGIGDVKLDVTSKKRPEEEEERKDTSFCDRSNNPILKTADLSAILESKGQVEKKVLVIQKVDIPKETMDLFEDPEVCRICFAEVLNSTSNQASFSCGHKFCKTCVTSHLNINITNGKVLMIKCLYGGCPRTFTDEEIKDYVDNTIFSKYRKFKITQLKMSNPNITYINCPSPDCEEILEYVPCDEDEYMRECNAGHKFCINCKALGWHKGDKCKNYDDLLLGQIQKNTNSQNYKKCPQCSVIIEKNEGCNQMKCLNCSFEFCWLCMNKYTSDHYAIYNFTGCPGMRFNAPEEKQWWSNPYLKVLWFILSFFLGILAVVGLLLFFVFFGCCYEFVNCYVNRSMSEAEEEEMYNNNRRNMQQAENQNNNNYNNGNAEIPERKNDNRIIGLLIALGVLCQPLYLLFYVLYGLMECYRKFSCWFYYVDY